MSSRHDYPPRPPQFRGITQERNTQPENIQVNLKDEAHRPNTSLLAPDTSLDTTRALHSRLSHCSDGAGSHPGPTGSHPGPALSSQLQLITSRPESSLLHP